MPLLNGKPLELHNYTKRLKDDEEVFYCELTNEIFQTYDEYYERVTQCNAMVWACAITGKTGLTYREALQCEEQALKNIKDFAPELRTPVLYLATLTQRDHFAEMADDVFNFVRDRYFIGESVQVCFDGGIWSYGQIMKVILPKAEEVMSYAEENKIKHPVNHRPYPSALYKYEVEELLEENEDNDIVRIEVLPAEKIRRMKSLYTKDKNRAYLKQFTEQVKINSVWTVKQAIIDKYAISSLVFSDIFAGESPQFIPPPKKKISISKLSPKNGKLSQSSMKNFVVVKGSPDKSGFSPKPNQKKSSLTPGKNLKSSEKGKTTPKSLARSTSLKIQKKYASTIEKVATDYAGKKDEERFKKLEMLKKKKEEQRREKEKLANFAKEWQRKREDLECDDLKELPSPAAVDCLVPNQLFGDFIMILEFLSCFGKVLKVKDYFPFGLSFELLERALSEVEIAGPFSDILQLLLSAVFELQEEEDDEIRNRESSGDISLNESGDMSVREAVKAATQAARWSKTYHNVRLSELQMDAITVTDILRLHLLSSGGRAGDLSAKWRFQERGGYTSTDDPGLQFRLTEPHILKFLAVNSVAALPIVDKVKVVTCLINQILTYATVRDVIDERYEQVYIGKRELKNDQMADSKKERERLKKQKEAKEKEKEKNENEKDKPEKPVENSEEGKIRQEKEAEKRKNEYLRRMTELQDAAMSFQLLPLGRDRGYRRFWIFQALPGLFVEDDEELPGKCLPNPTVINKTSISIDEEDTMTYIRKIFEAGRSSTGSDKENEGDGNQAVGTPKKKHFGEMNGVCLPSPAPSDHQTPVKAEDSHPLICTANYVTCAVHNRSMERTKWSFFYKEEDLNELIKSLNKRGYRENALRQTLISEKERVLKYINKCPVQKINRFVPLIHDLPVNKVIGTRSIKGYDNANLKYPKGTPVDTILEMYLRQIIVDVEEKIYGGGLGALKVRDRIAWRAALENCSYESQDPDLTWPTKMVTKAPKEEEDGPSRPGTPCSVHSNGDNDDAGCPDQSPVVKDLAMSVLQIARSVEPKYLQKPLPFEEKRPVKLTIMERWELSLMKSTSFSQVYLHLSSLENSIQWNKSVLNARCKICRRGKDDANMLLCDGCDRGFHLYCLKPKLNSIPKGEWFCPACRPKEKPKSTSRRRRLLDSDEEDEEPLARGRESEKRRRGEDPLDDLRNKRGRYP